MAVTPETLLRRGAEIYYAPVGTEQGVMLNVNANRYHGLNAVGARIWELLETPRTVSELCGLLLEEFEVDAETCRATVLDFANELLERGIIHAGPA